MVTSTIEELTFDPDLMLAGNPKIMRLQLEAQRVNRDLIQLLLLYRYENEKLSPNLTENNLEDFIEEVAIENRALAQARGIEIETECDPFLCAYFDDNLVRSVIHNAVYNSQRYTRNRLRLSAEESNNYIVLRVEDNGEGFPDHMLELQAALDTSEHIHQGQTQLGLYFANLMAQIHTNRDRHGFIRLENKINLSGGCFSLWLP
jgi:K+-sensing histidine kinase KdpD